MSENVNNQITPNHFTGNKNTLNISSIIIGILICLTIIGVSLFISQTDVYIKNIGTATTQDGKLTNTISVNGDGMIYAKPDMVTIRIGISETKLTSTEALESVNQKITQIKNILTDNTVNPDDIQTTGLNIYTEYDWSNNTNRRILGQTASQYLTFDIKNIDEQATKASRIIDKLGEIDKTNISSITFDINNKEEFMSQARQLAYQKAEQKAEELAKLGKVKLLKPVSISDISYDIGQNSTINYHADASTPRESPSQTTISTGQLQISIQISVVFGIE